VIFLSRWSPRYLTISALESCTLFMWTGGHIPVRVVKVKWTDLSALACMRHLWSQVWSALSGSGVSGKLWLGHCPLRELLCHQQRLLWLLLGHRGPSNLPPTVNKCFLFIVNSCPSWTSCDSVSEYLTCTRLPYTHNPQPGAITPPSVRPPQPR
jgi:hypothetical protein